MLSVPDPDKMSGFMNIRSVGALTKTSTRAETKENEHESTDGGVVTGQNPAWSTTAA
jgi:hypothetical protein